MQKRAHRRAFPNVAERTGLEPATTGVTGRYSNQLNYRSKIQPHKLVQMNKLHVEYLKGCILAVTGHSCQAS